MAALHEKIALHAEYASCLLLRNLSQCRATGLQIGCMVTVLDPVVRLPDFHVYALWP